MEKTPQIAGEQLVMTMDKTQKTKLQRYQVSILMFSADISKSEEISRCERKHCDFSATNKFSKNCQNFLSEGLTFFLAMDSTRSETKHSPRLRGNTQAGLSTKMAMEKISCVIDV